MSNSENDIKIQMLNEFETQVDDLFNRYNEHKLTFEDLINLLNNLKIVWDCCRVDIKNFAGQSSYIRVLSSMDDFTLSYPGWFNDNNGQGCKIEGQGHIDELKIQCNTGGKLNIDMRGLDYRNANDERIPVYINYTKFSINYQPIFDENKLVWHNQPFVYSKESKKDDIYVINLEYKTIFTYFHHLTTFFNNPKDIETAKEEYKLLKEFIASERNLLEIEINQKEPNITSQQEQIITLKKNMDLMTQKYDEEITSLKEDLNKYRETNYEFLNTLFIFCDVKSKGLLKYVQSLNTELLDFMVKIFDKYDLDYWLDFGLLLGAVRHNGFIPWDDDLDIGMMRKDYNKLLEVIEDEIEENGLSDVLRISLNMHQYKPLPILQLLYYSEEVGDSIIAGIDILPYDYIEDISNCDESTYKMIQQRVTERNLEGMPIEEALKEYYGYFDLRDEPAQYIIPGVEGARGIFYGYDVKIFKTKDIYPLKMMQFENKEYKIPSNYNEYLSQTYGNYLNIPKTIHHHQDRYEQYRLREDAKEIFDKNIEKLRKINEKLE